MYTDTLLAAKTKFIASGKAHLSKSACYRSKRSRSCPQSKTTATMTLVLNYAFELSVLPCRQDKECLATLLGVPYKRIHTWFQNARYRRTRAYQEGKRPPKLPAIDDRRQMSDRVHEALRLFHLNDRRYEEFLPLESWYGTPETTSRPVFAADCSDDEYFWDENDEITDDEEFPPPPSCLVSPKLSVPVLHSNLSHRLSPIFSPTSIPTPFIHGCPQNKILDLFDPLGSCIVFSDHYAAREERAFPLAYWPRLLSDIAQEVEAYSFPAPTWRRKASSEPAPPSSALDLSALLTPLCQLSLRSRTGRKIHSRQSRKRCFSQTSDSSIPSDDNLSQPRTGCISSSRRSIAPLPRRVSRTRRVSHASTEDLRRCDSSDSGSLSSSPSALTHALPNTPTGSFDIMLGSADLLEERSSKRCRASHWVVYR
ncbi:hypothetical protein SISSUDRAFT_494186 [Sistotremastrum suecicum HHB10207 ss-3]|uniref:Homeobox domain-containing protein n=1 Tax=Sistotremastrum suecicum HHB10207 ss-3 TaxID=1314776 RepID=A0A166IH30_9AGAM|nr:hypothetical protein SISSUDRAFT_494186 [Sistotremastrum suecicum HHB10207 ss-3]